MKKIMIYIFLFLSLVTLSSCSFDDTYIINQDVQTIAIGEKTVLKLSNDIGDITWKSSDEAIATVDEFGVVTGISGGIVTITATVENNTYSIMVSVDAKKSDPIIVISGNQTIYVGETTTLTAKVFNATIEENLLWSSNNEKIATVNEKGVVKYLEEIFFIVSFLRACFAIIYISLAVVLLCLSLSKPFVLSSSSPCGFEK